MSNKNKYSFIKPNKFPFFYGYIVLVMGTIGVWASIPGQTVGVSVFTDPVKDALGLSRNQFSNAYMIGTFISAFFVTRAGVLFDKYGARYVAFFATVILAGSLVLASVSPSISLFFQNLINSSSWIIPFIVITFLFFMIRFSGQGVLTMASRNMIMIWFDKNRGKVNAISGIAVSLGFSSSPIFIDKIIDNNGWQLSWQLIALGLLIFSVFILQFYRNNPEDFNLKPDGLRETSAKANIQRSEHQFTLQEAKATRAFWVFGLLLAFNSFFITGFTFHVVSIFDSQNYSKAEAISIFLPISVIAIIIGTIFNVLSDYIGQKILFYLMLCGGFLASVGLLLLSNTEGIYLLVIGLGFLGGLFSVINAVTWPRYYGRKFLGSITGKVMSFLVIASAIAPALFSYSFTVLGSYSYISYVNIVFLLFLALASLKIKNPQ